MFEKLTSEEQRYEDLMRRFEAQWRAPPPDLARVLEELGIGDGAPKRHLLESEAFRALLLGEPAPVLAEAA